MDVHRLVGQVREGPRPRDRRGFDIRTREFTGRDPRLCRRTHPDRDRRVGISRSTGAERPRTSTSIPTPSHPTPVPRIVPSPLGSVLLAVETPPSPLPLAGGQPNVSGEERVGPSPRSVVSPLTGRTSRGAGKEGGKGPTLCLPFFSLSVSRSVTVVEAHSPEPEGGRKLYPVPTPLPSRHRSLGPPDRTSHSPPSLSFSFRSSGTSPVSVLPGSDENVTRPLTVLETRYGRERRRAGGGTVLTPRPGTDRRNRPRDSD